MNYRNNSYYPHFFIGLFALLVGFPYLGFGFKLLMVPYVAYLTYRCDAKYIPILIILCAHVTMAALAIPMTCMFLGWKKYSVLKNNGVHHIYILLLMMLPVFLMTAYHRLAIEDFNQALLSISDYFSFWVLIYGVLVAPTFNREIADRLVLTMLLLSLVAPLRERCPIDAFIKILVFAFIPCFAIHRWPGGKKFIILVIFLLVVSLNKTTESTFTIIGSVFLAVAYYYSYVKKKKWIKYITGILPYCLIVILMIWGITSYMNQNMNALETGETSFELFLNPEKLIERIKFKLFEDRVPYWCGAWKQIMYQGNIFPPVKVEEISAVFASGKELEDISFGGHNTPLELLRRSGWLCGLILIYVYVWSSIRACHVFRNETLSSELLVFCITSATQVMYFLTGTAFVLIGNAPITFCIIGVMIAYNNSKVGQSYMSEKD